MERGILLQRAMNAGLIIRGGIFPKDHRLQGFIQNRSQIRFDYFELSWHHGNVLREIVDYVPGRPNLIRGPAGDPKPGLRGARRRTEASPIGEATRTTSLPAGTQGRSP